MEKQQRSFGLRDVIRGFRSIIGNGLEFKRYFFWAMAMMTFTAIVTPIATYIFGRFIDSLKSGTTYDIAFLNGPISASLVLLLVWAIIQIVLSVTEYIRTMNNLRLRQNVRMSYIARVADHILRLPLSFHKNHKMGETLDRTDRASNAMADLLTEEVTNIFPLSISLVIMLWIMFGVSHFLGIAILVGLAIYILSSAGSASKTVPLQREVQRIYSAVRGDISDAVMNVRIVKDFVTEGYQKDKTDKDLRKGFVTVWLRMMGIQRGLIFRQTLVIVCTRIAVLGFSLYLLNKGSITIGTLVIANTYVGAIFDPISQISRKWRDIQNGMIAVEDAQAVLAAPTEVYVPVTLKAPLKHITGAIEFRDVSFGYDPKSLIIENISLTSAAGEIVALVGESGVGKSTLIDLICAYYFPTKGVIYIDGVDIKDIDLALLRKSIGIVTQELTLFNDSIINNIRYGNFDRSDEEVYAAARKAHCYDFIERFPEKWDQVVGERGLKLSVGQKQRIAIARAILKNPHILILDEPTSALDAGSEKIITDSLDELMKGKTTFIVAHRLSTVRRADKILVFKEGRIIESGKHDELLQIKGGEYRRLYELQIGLHA